MQIDFLGMQAFLAIAEHGSFQQAALHLNLSQTAISHRIRKLENSLGTRLLARTTRDVTLTDAGQALLPRVRGAMRELALSYDTVRQHRNAAPQWLAFACLPTLAAQHLSPILRDFGERHPHLAIRVFDNSINEIAELVESGIAAFGVSVAAPVHAALTVEPFAEEPFVLACPAGHLLARQPRVCWDQLRDEALIRISLPAGNSTTIDDALGERRLHLRWIYETQHTAVALNFVEEGLGLTVVPALSIPASASLVARPLGEPGITRRLAIVTRHGATLAPEAAMLRDRIMQALAGAASIPQLR
ncbi:HTH lysR-type domain-containing protein [Bordetella tumbae]|uniref:LysR family transcriptional regulator n=1 Tax=Bordetella tumbae TaxID=1649139 RepID=UPI0039F024BF